MSFSGEAWKEIFNSLKNTCKETKLVEKKKEFFGCGTKIDDECLYCGEQDSTDHTFNDC